ncbi:squalene monooxygenase SE1 [Nicotiana tabacum]|uniref:Squalene monooxygenase n=1 Tax=Nicotiana tabacum TaxID=4097 RepID=A0A1S3Y467_TOBAC|nr:squalene monooxygenase SE2-like [Nicotiana tomentosiformis]XP_016446677.1 PREDICTED: squalene monooxygenase-like [Nicotiana tabacum]
MVDMGLSGSVLAVVFGFVAVLWFFIQRNGGRKDKNNDPATATTSTTTTTVYDGECRSKDANDNADIIIVGAGVAGAALAHTLGKEGRRVKVIERDLTEPDRIVGELLQPGGFLKLQELGLEDCVENIDAQRVFGYALFKDGKSTRLSYPLEKFHAEVSGRSFHNGRFIQRMREKAASLPNVKLEQGTVTSLLEENGTIRGVQYKNKSGEELKAYAPLTIVCDGCFSNLRRTLCDPKVEVPSCFVGLVLENCQLPHANHGHVILADPSPILFYPISSTEVRCLVDVPGQKVPSISNGEMGKYLKSIVAPQVPPEIKDAFIAAIDKGNIRTMPNRSMPAAPHPTPGALLMGDAFNMRHPLTGGGMTVALSDIVVLRDLLKPLRDLNDAPTLCRYLESFYTLRKPVASTINTLAGALYKVFCASPDQARKEMRDACFDYLSLGGVFSTGPVSLLSGLNPRPLSLVCHFFAVAIYGVGRLLLPFPSPKRMWIGARLISGASGIIFPIIKAEGVRQMFFPATVPAYYRSPPEVKL